MSHWKKYSKAEIRERVFEALQQNVDFYKAGTLGVPGSHLDDKVFYQDAPFLKDAPFLTTMIHNPNHIGCHTMGESESFFQGTQAIEQELIALCAEDILRAEPGSCDGYVASGGTEANLQAVWIYRNYFMQEMGLSAGEITLLCSSDAHYSVYKAADVLGVNIHVVPVDADSRALNQTAIEKAVSTAVQKGCKAFVVVANMMTTMFGSVDDPTLYSAAIRASGTPFKMHVDGAYGGFVFPFTHPNNPLDFQNPDVCSVTLDAHKMVQAPYGTGIFLVRKDWMHFANTREASYVEGEDYTLVGSRSGANAVAVWMILMTYGRFGWEEKMSILLKRTDWLCARLDEKGLHYFRNPHANIVTMRAESVPAEVARRYGLVPDNHAQPNWYKVVVMEHVTIERLLPLVAELPDLVKSV